MSVPPTPLQTLIVEDRAAAIHFDRERFGQLGEEGVAT